MTDRPDPRAPLRARLAEHWVPLSLVSIIVVLAVVLVGTSLAKPPPATWIPTVPDPRERGEALVGPETVTVDARSGSDWTYFDFSRGSVVENPAPLDWDLAFRRFHVMVNGGPGFHGRGGAREIEVTVLDSLDAVPADGYATAVSARDSTSAAMARWYTYSWTSHLLMPRPTVFAVRTADGRYAALEILGYYCPGAEAGCLTMRYVYQGSGDRTLVAKDPSS